MIYHDENGKRIKAVWLGYPEMICCCPDDDRHCSLSLANRRDEQLLLYGDGGQC
ncbi:hypothetical protein [Bartonella gabonensis]|uniref:hypothetical protein n=1 Tax=Bartonella gabonensis TaxID=2699889 RepID=UPI00158D7853|nr:hypothetical protein [Bartonella gabonensis]